MSATICPWTCGQNSGVSCDYIISRAPAGVDLTCAGLEANGCNCHGCSRCGASAATTTVTVTTPQWAPTTSTARIYPPGPLYYSLYDYYYHYNAYGYGYNSDANASSMLWIIISVAAVFIIVTSILGFVVYRRRQARLRALAARSARGDGGGGGGRGDRPRVVTEIEIQEVSTLPFVERVHDEPGSAAYPVAQSLTVVTSRTPSPRAASRTSSFTSLSAYTRDGRGTDDDDDEGVGDVYNEEAYTPGAGHSPVVHGRVQRVGSTDAGADGGDIPVAVTSLTSLTSLPPAQHSYPALDGRGGSAAAAAAAAATTTGGRYRTGSESSVNSADSFVQPGFSSWTFEGAAAAAAAAAAEEENWNAAATAAAGDGLPDSDCSDSPRAPPLPAYPSRRGGGSGGGDEEEEEEEEEEAAADDRHYNQMAVDLMSEEDEEDDDTRLARALSLSMQALALDDANSDAEASSRRTTAGTGGGADESVEAAAPTAAPVVGATTLPPPDLQCVEEDDDIVQLHQSHHHHHHHHQVHPNDDEDDAQSEATADIASSDSDGEDVVAAGSVTW